MEKRREKSEGETCWRAGEQDQLNRRRLNSRNTNKQDTNKIAAGVVPAWEEQMHT